MNCSPDLRSLLFHGAQGSARSVGLYPTTRWAPFRAIPNHPLVIPAHAGAQVVKADETLLVVRLLVAEDDAALRDVLERGLCEAGYVVDSVDETRIDGALVALTPREFAIIELLVRKSPTIVQRRSIALHAWPEEADAVGSNAIDVHIARLRAKLARCDARIETLRGSGYRMTASPQ